MTSTSADTGLALSPVTIAGIVIGVVAGMALLAGACVYLRRLGAGRGRFTRLRKGRPSVDPEEEFLSRGLSFHIGDHEYGYRQHPCVSLDPLLISSPPETYTVSGPPSLRDAPYLPYPIDPVLPPIDLGTFSLNEPDDPYARVERAILPVSRAHHVSSRRQPQELDQLYKTLPNHSSPRPPLFINRTLARPLGPELSSSRMCSPLFYPTDLLQYASSRRASSTQSLESRSGPMSPGDTGGVSQSKLRRVISETALTERTTLTRLREDTVGGETFGAESAEVTFSQTFAPYAPEYTCRQPRTSSPRLPRLPGLSPVAEGSVTIDLPSPHDITTNTEMTKNPSLSLSELQKSSSLSVALSHNGHTTGHEPSSFALLASNNTFGKTDSSASSQRWTTCSSSGLATRYPSLAPSSLGPTPSSSNHQSESASEWRRPPAGLAALTNIQLEPTGPSPSSTPGEIPDLPLPHTPRQSMLPVACQTLEVKPHKAYLRAHAPASVPEVEWKLTVQGGIASIDVSL